MLNDHNALQVALSNWAVAALARWARVEQNLVGPPAGVAAEPLGNYGCALRNGWKLDGTGDSLLSIFSLIKPPSDHTGQPYRPTPIPARRLDPSDLLNTQPEPPCELWRGFAAGYGQLPKNDARFEAFGHLLHQYAWAVPCTYGEDGVSLYQEFKALAGLMAASAWDERPAERYTLVGGDLSGIQDFIYTITSKGAAKGLRGRSFFLQLIGDAVVRRLVANLRLCWANVVYQAGGNFMLLAPDGEETTQVVDEVRRRVNIQLMKATQADLYLVITSKQIERPALFDPKRFLAEREQLGKQFEVIKRQPLAGLATDWAATFEPQGRGSDLSCAVCHVEVDERSSRRISKSGELPIPGEPAPRACNLCLSFGQLAREIGHNPLYVAIRRRDDMFGVQLNKREDWRMLLTKMTGFTYRFGTSPKDCPSGDIIEAINNSDFLPSGATGFRVLANVTPRVTEIDIAYLSKSQDHEERPDTEAGKLLSEEKVEEKLPSKDDIRSFSLLAHAAGECGAIERVGVLRMDLDGLGHTFSAGVPKLTLPVLSALSEAFEMFIGGYLNTLARRIGGNDVYIIYAGGDDLFIVGAWHRLPALAEAIQRDFKAYTGQHPALSISGGLTLEGAHFPLYRAAERSEAAEHAAKHYTRPDGNKKNAFCFLGTVVGWEEEEWDVVRAQKDNLLWLTEDQPPTARPGEPRLSRALLQTVQSIHRLYRDALRRANDRARRQRQEARQAGAAIPPMPDPRLILGRWMWMQVYALARARGSTQNDEAQNRLKQLQDTLMKPDTVRLSGLAARWAELLTRKEE